MGRIVVIGCYTTIRDAGEFNHVLFKGSEVVDVPSMAYGQ